MRLYLHSTQCPVALRSFLDCNPNYWCFIPMSRHDAATAASDLELNKIVQWVQLATNE